MNELVKDSVMVKHLMNIPSFLDFVDLSSKNIIERKIKNELNQRLKQDSIFSLSGLPLRKNQST